MGILPFFDFDGTSFSEENAFASKDRQVGSMKQQGALFLPLGAGCCGFMDKHSAP